jgi:hypothetical protein
MNFIIDIRKNIDTLLENNLRQVLSHERLEAQGF